LVFLSRVPLTLQALQRYAVLRPLGDGGMSSVYLARRRLSEQLCVLKTIVSVDGLAGAAWQAEALQCLRREAALLDQLDHPRVAHVLDWLSDTAGDYLVLDYVAGPTLEQRLSRVSAHGKVIAGAALPPAEALAYGASVAETLCYLADLPQPVVHCDIKPANLIVPPRTAEPVLVDFGGAVSVAPSAQSAVPLDRYGTPGYAAPEQYGGACSPKSDVYGLAATLYHLLTDDDPSAHPLAFPALGALPPEVGAVLAPALERDPGARPDAPAFRMSLGLLL
jgi:serine/threonine-protein kinase